MDLFFIISPIFLICASITFFSLPLPTLQIPQDVKAEADVDVLIIQEADGSMTPIVIADARAEIKTNTRRKQLEVEASASVDIHQLKDILPKKIGDVENLLKTFYLYKSTKATAPLIQSDAPVCTNRYSVDTCIAVKWQYSVGSEYQLISKLWGYDSNNLIYVQENLNWLSPEHHIIKSLVTNVMKANARNLIAEPCLERADLVEYLDDVVYGIFNTDWDNFVIFKTIDKLDSITFVALTEEAYHREDKSEIDQKISQALSAHKVDVNTMKTFQKSFEVKTNSIKPKNENS